MKLFPVFPVLRSLVQHFFANSSHGMIAAFRNSDNEQFMLSHLSNKHEKIYLWDLCAKTLRIDITLKPIIKLLIIKLQPD